MAGLGAPVAKRQQGEGINQPEQEQFPHDTSNSVFYTRQQGRHPDLLVRAFLTPVHLNVRRPRVVGAI